ncbi:hypothetical protein [Streptomyces sp. NPDC057363]|uniref:hypothetical protein n=1 Tax=Streptomyces sp. NPDC057363 TaxID=3346107 RepID=UPI00362F7C3F
MSLSSRPGAAAPDRTPAIAPALSRADTVPTLIYDALIAERGDVPAEARRTAEQELHKAKRAVHWNGPYETSSETE